VVRGPGGPRLQESIAPGCIFVDTVLADEYRPMISHQEASNAIEAPMRPTRSVNPTSEHALFLRLFLTGGGGW